MITYIIKSGLILSLFYLFFILFMKKTTFFRFNRVMLMVGSFLCILLPLFDISFLPDPVESNMPHLVIPEANMLADREGISGGWNWMTALSVIYFAGAAVVFTYNVISILKISAIFRGGESFNRDGYIVTLSEQPMASFSFFHHIVMSREDYDKNAVILLHERMHVDFRHSIDIVMFSFITAFHWFNPLVWIARNELKEIQEYEADEAVLKQGIDATQYQLLMVKKAVGAERFQMANGFNHTKLKNRIMMMQKNKSNKMARLAYIACLPILLGTLCFCSGNNNNAKSADGSKFIEGEPAAVTCDIDTAPKFNGGGSDAFAGWVTSNLNYPQECKENGIEGRIETTFVIDAEGNLVDAKITKGVCKSLDDEVIRVLNSSPKWTPATVKGKNVRVELCMPVQFALK